MSKPHWAEKYIHDPATTLVEVARKAVAIRAYNERMTKVAVYISLGVSGPHLDRILAGRMMHARLAEKCIEWGGATAVFTFPSLLVIEDKPVIHQMAVPEVTLKPGRKKSPPEEPSDYIQNLMRDPRVNEMLRKPS